MASFTRTRVLALAGLLWAGPLSAADQAPPNPNKVERKAEKERLRDQIVDKFRTERMWELTNALKLDQATAARLFPLLSKYDDEERAIAKERGPLARDLRDALDAANPDGTRINGLVDKLLGIRQRRQAMELEKLTAIRKVLTPAQMGKLVLVAPAIEEGFRDRIKTAVQAARRGGDLPR
jgi:Spy/CpxP family protein refolding chaperone